ncbi:hypothetical protein DPEC_G00299080 [Dallia pectoralis]|uniref:Uncharacterized protein n=1 Tax=Dallia pectoralis TaxID=75939 RepID=A0ACC2FGD9_DALPE|nr:hypothetical protein DPEC_G00299080 [Dallia pectoralis]
MLQTEGQLSAVRSGDTGRPISGLAWGYEPPAFQKGGRRQSIIAGFTAPALSPLLQTAPAPPHPKVSNYSETHHSPWRNQDDVIITERSRRNVTRALIFDVIKSLSGFKLRQGPL